MNLDFFSGKSNGNIAFKGKYLKCWRWLSIFLSIACLLAVVSAKHAKKCSKMPEMKGHQNKPLEEGNKNIPNLHEYKKLHKMKECKNMPNISYKNAKRERQLTSVNLHTLLPFTI